MFITAGNISTSPMDANSVLQQEANNTRGPQALSVSVVQRQKNPLNTSGFLKL